MVATAIKIKLLKRYFYQSTLLISLKDTFKGISTVSVFKNIKNKFCNKSLMMTSLSHFDNNRIFGSFLILNFLFKIGATYNNRSDN